MRAMDSGAITTSSRGTETCARLVIGNSGKVIFLKGSWFSSHFSLSITDGCHSWVCKASEQVVADRAGGWDETVTEYVESAQHYLSHQRPDSSYDFVLDGDNGKLSWTMEKHGIKLEGKWKCERARNDQQVTFEVLDFLMDSNIKLSEELVRKRQSFEKLKLEAEKCLEQSKVFKDEKKQFEVDIYKKFVAVLNSKKVKLRELRDRISKLEPKNDSGIEDSQEDETDNDDDDGDDDNDNAKVETHGDVEDAPVNASEAKDIMLDEGLNNRENVNSRKDVQVTDISVCQPSKGQVDDASANVDNKESGGRVTRLSGSDSKMSEDPVESAAALLADSEIHTTAPKRRRRL